MLPICIARWTSSASSSSDLVAPAWLNCLRGRLGVASHEEAEPFLVRRGRVECRDDASLEHDRDAVRESADLVELARYQEDRGALIALFEESLMYVLGRGDIQPARRLAGDEQLGPIRDL